MGEATRMDISKQWIISFGKDVDKFEPFIHCWRECKLMQLLGRIAWQFFKNLYVELPLDLSVTLLGTLQKRKHIHTNTCQHSNIVHKAKKRRLSNSTPRYLPKGANNMCSYKNL